MNELKQTALVTGGSRGIGQAVAEALAASGWQVYLTYAQQQAKAESVCQGIISRGGTAQAFALDLSRREDVSAFFQKHIKNKVRLGVLVNNAGLTKDGLLLRLKKSDWDAVLQVNLDGPFACLQEAAKIMVKQKKGRIINLSSVVGLSGNPGQTNYCAAKAGIIGVTKAAAQELGVRNITVNAVAPGFIATDMTDELPDETRRKYLEKIPLGRFGTTQDVAETVVWLASDQAAYITGQVISVNGGLYM